MEKILDVSVSEKDDKELIIFHLTKVSLYSSMIVLVEYL